MVPDPRHLVWPTSILPLIIFAFSLYAFPCVSVFQLVNDSYNGHGPTEVHEVYSIEEMKNVSRIS